PGTAVMTVGCSQGDPPTPQADVICDIMNVRRPDSPQPSRMWQLWYPCRPGRSGGPMLDTKGRLLGISCGRSGGKGYYAHTSEIREFLREHDIIPPSRKSDPTRPKPAG
ncbi:MAG: hypothetical protein ACODAD_11460, partial [Planctomycetota bacterium]